MKNIRPNSAEIVATIGEVRAGASVAGVARRRNHHPNTIRAWIERYDRLDSEQIETQRRFATENARLRCALGRLVDVVAAVTVWFSEDLENSLRIGATGELEDRGLSQRQACTLTSQPRRVLQKPARPRSATDCARQSDQAKQRIGLRKLLLLLNGGERRAG